MRIKGIVLLFLGILFFFADHSTAQPSKEITCKGKVLDSQSRSVAGAKVKICLFEREDDWGKENEISFPWGIIENDDEKTRLGSEITAVVDSCR